MTSPTPPAISPASRHSPYYTPSTVFTPEGQRITGRVEIKGENGTSIVRRLTFGSHVTLPIDGPLTTSDSTISAEDVFSSRSAREAGTITHSTAQGVTPNHAASSTGNQNATPVLVIRQPLDAKFTHEISAGSEGFATRVISLNFSGNVTFKDVDERLRSSVPELDQCLYVRYGRCGVSKAFVVFDDTRVALQAYESFTRASALIEQPYVTEFVSYDTYGSECKLSITSLHGFETQAVASVRLEIPDHMMTLANASVLAHILDRAHKFVSHLIFEQGDWKMYEFTRKNAFDWHFRVEFFSAEHAGRFRAAYHEPQRISFARSTESPDGRLHMRVQTGPTFEAENAERNAEKFKLRSPRVMSAYYSHRALGPFNPSRPEDGSNQIDPAKLESGRDVRCTVMLRNIPNKMNCAEIKEFLDKYCRYTYDFLYLRIDFENDCNVGYAFINFCAPGFVKEFYAKVHGYTWEMVGSGKTASVCYATTQGKEALVERFRNSCVSQKLPWMRPHLYISMADWPEHMTEFPKKRLGDELAFPEPNNINKLHRSMAIADEQGLFHNRDRRSGDVRGFDRGNPNNVPASPHGPRPAGLIGMPTTNGPSPHHATETPRSRPYGPHGNHRINFNPCNPLPTFFFSNWAFGSPLVPQDEEHARRVQALHPYAAGCHFPGTGPY